MTHATLFKRSTAALIIASLLSSCGTLDADSELSKKLASRGFDHPEFNGSFLPEGSFHLSSSYSVTYADAMLVAGALVLIYFVVDPRAPRLGRATMTKTMATIKTDSAEGNRAVHSMRWPKILKDAATSQLISGGLRRYASLPMCGTM